MCRHQISLTWSEQIMTFDIPLSYVTEPRVSNESVHINGQKKKRKKHLKSIHLTDDSYLERNQKLDRRLLIIEH